MELLLTTDQTAARIVNPPAGTAIIHQASSTTKEGGATVYKDLAYNTGLILKPADTSHPWVSAEPRSPAGAKLGVWTPRIRCEPVAVTPPATIKVGLDSGGWLLTNDQALNEGKLKLMRGQNMPSERLIGYGKAGWQMIDLIGHNPATNVNPTTLAAEAVARAKTYPAIVATEILNEPQNPYLAGSESQANIEAYARVVNKVAAALHEAGSRSVPLWSADGGYKSVPSWGAKVWPLLDANAKANARATTHPYGGKSSAAESALGNRKRVEEAHALTGKKGWVTEVGWPTATGKPPTGDSLQWTETQQAQNIEVFVKWAPAHCETVIIFNYRDYGTNMWYGVESHDGRHKPSFATVQKLA